MRNGADAAGAICVEAQRAATFVHQLRWRRSKRGAGSLGSGHFATDGFLNYRELVRPAIASAWFSISPAAGDKLLVLPRIQIGEQKPERKSQKEEGASGVAN